MNLEEDLRVTLRDRATAAMPPAEILKNVTAGVRRDKRRRRLMASGAAVATVAAILAVPLFARGADRPSPLPADPPAPSVAWGGPWRPSPVFSKRPGWFPPDLGTARVFQMGPNELIQWDDDGRVFSAEFGPIEPDWEVEAERSHPATVGGRPAVVHLSDSYDGSGPDDRFVGVRWQDPIGLWVQVLSLGPRTEAEVLRFAASLRDDKGSMAGVPSKLGFAETPPGLTWQFLSPDSACLTTEERATRSRQPEGLCVNLLDEPYSPDPEAEELLVGGKAAHWFPDAASVTVKVDDKRVLLVTWDPEELPLTRDDMIRFAEGITYTR